MSGNPAGKRAGTVSLKAGLQRAGTPRDAELIGLKLLALAKSGHIQAAQLVGELTGDIGPHAVSLSVTNELAAKIEQERTSKGPIDFEELTRLAQKLFFGAEATQQIEICWPHELESERVGKIIVQEMEAEALSKARQELRQQGGNGHHGAV